MKKIFFATMIGAITMMGMNNEAMAQGRNNGAAGAIIGAGIGALTGAAINKYNPAAGAAVGGLIGAGIGYLASNQQMNGRTRVVYTQNQGYYRDRDRRDRYYNERDRYYNERNRRERRYNEGYDNCGRRANYNNGYGGY